MANRRKTREFVLQALYAQEVSGNTAAQVFNNIIKSQFSGERNNLAFAEQLFFQTLENQETIDAIIKKHINNWNINRLATFDKVTLRVAICEFLYFQEIPTKVTMNEAIEIVKDFSTQKSGNFINGILDSALARLKRQGRINKKGRGLIESSVNT